jgi:hypothetical protein
MRHGKKIYRNGYSIIKGGLIYEATLGGQKFSYRPNK